MVQEKIKIKIAPFERRNEIKQLLFCNQDEIGNYSRVEVEGIETRVYVGQCLYALNEEDKVIGCISYELSKLCVDIFDLCVDEEYRRRGIATRLIRCAIRDARQFCKHNLIPRIKALNTNKVANEFYSKIGVKIGEDKNEGSTCYQIMQIGSVKY